MHLSDNALPHRRGQMPKLFKNPILDGIFSQVHFSVPLILYLPLIGYLSYRATVLLEVSVLPFLGLFLLGLVAWTFFEYALHRWLLHWIPERKWGQKLHFWLHGIHHDYPEDTRVVPPGRSIPGFLVLWLLAWFTLGEWAATCVFPGFVLGYLAYEMVHYATHHARWQNKWFKKLQRHHMYHHYRNHDSAFGFTGTIWDRILRTRFEDLGD